MRRTWPQRLLLAFNIVLVLACVGAAGAVWYGNHSLGSLERVTIANIGRVPASGTTTLVPGGAPLPGGSVDVTVPAGSGGAQNFLLVGSDSRACVDPSSPDAAALLGNGDAGARTDTIMVLRIDPNQEQAAILSFPRDLWVKVPGTNRRTKINGTWEQENPSRLVQTIAENFGVPIDHYVEIDFCAFKRLVDAIGGVRVPFLYAARDTQIGFTVAQPGCVAFSGIDALKYVRSRHYEYYDGARWRDDKSSDFGRIARQQDFIRRALSRAVDRGARNPAVARSLIGVALQNVRVDQTITVNDMLSLATRLRNFDPEQVRSFQIPGTATMLGSNSVVLPDDTPTARKLLAVFRGEASLSSIEPPTTTPAPTTTASPATTSSVTTLAEATTVLTTVAPTIAPPAAPAGGTTTASTVVVADNTTGIVPPNDPACR